METLRISRFVAFLAALGAMVSVQGGASFAKALFPVVGPAGATLLRVGIAAALLCAIFRPRICALSREQLGRIVPYGLSIAAMNQVFYVALERTPLGVCVTAEFVGPLSLAVLLSRRPVDFLWVSLAITGILLIVPWTDSVGAVPLSGVLWAMGAGVGWALYILATNHVTKITRSTDAAALGMTVAALAVLPFALVSGGIFRMNGGLLLPALCVAVFSSALPFTLELVALKGLPEKTFSIALSVEPAIAALSGLVFLHERLTPLQLLAMGAVIAASVGSTLTSGGRE